MLQNAAHNPPIQLQMPAVQMPPPGSQLPIPGSTLPLSGNQAAQSLLPVYGTETPIMPIFANPFSNSQNSSDSDLINQHANSATRSNPFSSHLPNTTDNPDISDTTNTPRILNVYHSDVQNDVNILRLVENNPFHTVDCDRQDAPSTNNSNNRENREAAPDTDTPIKIENIDDSYEAAEIKVEPVWI